jgi:signal transduction histidine kinase
MFKKLRTRILVFNMVVTTLLVAAAVALVYATSYLVIKSSHDMKLAYTYTNEDGVFFSISRGSTDQPGAATSGDEASDSILVGTLPLVSGVMSNDGYSATLNLSLDARPSFTALVCDDGQRARLRALVLFGAQGEKFCRAATELAWNDFVLSGVLLDEGARENGTLLLGGNDLRYSITLVEPFRQAEFLDSIEEVPIDGEALAIYDSTPRGTAAKTGDAGALASVSPETWYQVNFVDTTIKALNSSTLVITAIVAGASIVVVILLISLFFTRRAVRPIEAMYEQQRRLVADASHELKTPLATIMANYDVVMLDEQASVGSQREWLTAMRTSMDRMGRTIAGLLSLAQAEDSPTSGAADRDVLPVALGDVVADELRLREGEIAVRGLSLTRKLDDEVTVRADEEQLRQVVAILVDNALTYSDEGGRVECTVERRGRQAILVMSNSGPGIPKQDTPHVFERFYRVDKARSSEGGHAGLGLAIARTLVERAGGRIEVESIPDAWTAFTVTLPATAGPASRPLGSTPAQCPPSYPPVSNAREKSGPAG